MIRKVIASVALAGLVAATPALAAPCKDGKGKFIKCPATAPAKPAPAAKPTPAVKPAPAAKPAPAPAPAPSASATPAAAGTSGKNAKSGRCHVLSGPKKGQFTKCPS